MVANDEVNVAAKRRALALIFAIAQCGKGRHPESSSPIEIYSSTSCERRA
jgi:hypothetical protein